MSSAVLREAFFDAPVMGYNDLLTPLVLTVTGERTFVDLTPCAVLPGARWPLTFDLS